MTLAIRVVHRGVGDQHSILVREHYEAVRHQQSIRPRRIGGGHGPDYVALVINLNEPAGASQRMESQPPGEVGTPRASASRAKSPGHESRVKMAFMTTNRSASFLLLALLSGAAVAAPDPKPLTAQEATDAAAETQMRINDAIPIVGKLKEDSKANDLLGRAKGIVIVPHYIQAALVFGGRGGSGLLLVRRGMKWSDPVFYRISGGTFGAQIGGTKGSLAFFLMSDKAIEAFENKASTWSMNAGAGLAAVSFSKQTPETATLTDVVVWSDTKGIFGGAAVGASRISRDVQANQIYYNNPEITAQQILSGAVTSPQSKLLLDVLPPLQAPKPTQPARPQ